MRQFTISATVATVFAALVLPAPAGALENWGPTKVGNQCFTSAGTYGRDLRFGSWGACPQSASVAVAPRHVRKHRSSH
jgi:hypothetical protein